MSQKNRKPRVQKDLQRCSICLSNIRLKGKLNSCEHSFCFKCIRQWSNVENTCPVCKRRFTQIQEASNAKLSASQSKRKKIRVAKIQKKNQQDRNYETLLQGLQHGLFEQIHQDFFLVGQFLFDGVQEFDFAAEFNEHETPMSHSIS